MEEVYLVNYNRIFYSENQENKKLELALNEMYKYYNALLKRMISFVEEEGAIPGAKENQ